LPVAAFVDKPDVSGGMNEFVLVTRWLVPAPIDAVWTALRDVRQWPSWWKYVKDVTELAPGDTNGVGVTHRFVWATRLPYRVVFDMRTVRIQRPVLIEGRASGDLNGTGRWELRTADRNTLVRYEWRVRAAKSWMKLLAPLLHPVFVWNHDAVMRAGKDGLLRHLGIQPSTGRHFQV
jgi:hypothetical protein